MRLFAGAKRTRLATVMHRGLSNLDHASFFSEATLIEIGVYSILTAKREGGGFSHSVLGTSNGPPQPNPIRVLLCSLNSRKTGKALLQSKSFEMLKW